MKTVKLVSPGSAFVVMLSVMDDAGGVELDSGQLEQLRGASEKVQLVRCTLYTQIGRAHV